MADGSDSARSITLGVEELDAEHRGQLRQMADLIAALERGDPRDEVARQLGELIDYLNAHFMSEQILMRERGYPGYGAHVREHDDAVAMLADLGRRHEAGDAAAAADLLRALRGWLVDHIRGLDRALAAFLTAPSA